MGRWSACADASSARFDEESTVPAGGRAAERPWNRIHSENEAAQRDLSVNQVSGSHIEYSRKVFEKDMCADSSPAHEIIINLVLNCVCPK